MTTSLLQTFVPGPLSDHDVQVLRDFALEAPPEWRHAFNELIEAYEEAEGRATEADNELKDFEELKTQVKEFKKTYAERLKKAEETLAAASRTANTPWVPGNPWLTTFNETKEDLQEMVDALPSE